MFDMLRVDLNRVVYFGCVAFLMRCTVSRMCPTNKIGHLGNGLRRRQDQARVRNHEGDPFISPNLYLHTNPNPDSKEGTMKYWHIGRETVVNSYKINGGLQESKVRVRVRVRVRARARETTRARARSRTGVRVRVRA
jgi:hypothetical protein